MVYGAHEGAVGRLDLWSCGPWEADAFTGNHASSDKRVARVHVDGLHHAPLLLTPRQQVIAQHRSVA